MTKPIDPYSRVYWRVLQDERFTDIRGDMRHFGSWTLMLVVADMAYPVPAFVPPSIPRASLAKLTECGLIEVLPGGLFRVHGLPAERERRVRTGTDRDPDRYPTGPRPDPRRPAPEPTGTLARAGVDETSKDEKRLDEDEHHAPELGPSKEEGDVFAAIAQAGAYIRPESGMGQRVVRLIARRGAETVAAELARLVKGGGLSDRQIVFGLEDALDKIPSAADARAEDVAVERDIRSRRTQQQAQARRVEAFRWTGVWDAEFGPEPEWKPEWGERPKVAA